MDTYIDFPSTPPTNKKGKEKRENHQCSSHQPNDFDTFFLFSFVYLPKRFFLSKSSYNSPFFYQFPFLSPVRRACLFAFYRTR